MAAPSAPQRRSIRALALWIALLLGPALCGCLNPPTPTLPLDQQLFAQPQPVPGPVIDLGVIAAPPSPVAPALETGAPLTRAPAPALLAAPAPAPLPSPDSCLPTSPIPGSAPIPTPLVGATDSGVLLSPSAIVAPVGANVIMVAGVYGPGRQMLAFERVEWTIAPGGVGQIAAIGDFSRGLLQGGLFEAPAQKISPMFAVGETFPRTLVISRGTALPGDALTIVRGQTWISVTSPIEGATYVTAQAPGMENWQTRQQTAVVHWVDSGWTVPPPVVAPAGSRHTLTTTVTRRSNGEPLAGWRVRYEITGGPAGGFAPDGVRAIEVPTNEIGQANVEVLQSKPEQGVNPILIQIIRPGGIVPGGQRLIVGTAATEVAWSAPRTALQIIGPQQATVGATASYQIRVTNPGDAPITNVVVTDPLPPGLTYLRSTPPAEVSVQGGGQPGGLKWTLGSLAPGETKTIDIDARAESAGALNNTAAVRTGEGLTGQDTVTTTVRAGAIELRLAGPDKAIVGAEVHFELDIINRGDTLATGLVLTDNFDAGLENPKIEGHSIKRDLEPLAPGQSRKVGMTFRVAQAGRLCHTVEVTGANGLHETTQACVEATADVAATPPNTTPPPASIATVSAKISVQPTARTGDFVLFTIEVKNTGSTKIPALQIVDTFDDTLLKVMETTAGYQLQGKQLSWTIRDFDAGGVARREVKCQCLAAGARACHQLNVTDGGGLNQQDEACLAIMNPDFSAGAVINLGLSVASRSNPIKVGGETSYVLTIINAGANPDRKVALTAVVPDSMQILEVPALNPARSTIDGQSVQFDPIAQMQPGERLTFEIRVRALRAGDALFRAQVTSQTQTQPVGGQTMTSIVAGQ